VQKTSGIDLSDSSLPPPFFSACRFIDGQKTFLSFLFFSLSVAVRPECPRPTVVSFSCSKNDKSGTLFPPFFLSLYEINEKKGCLPSLFFPLFSSLEICLALIRALFLAYGIIIVDLLFPPPPFIADGQGNFFLPFLSSRILCGCVSL